MVEPKINCKLALEHGLKKEEYQKILKILGRKPSFTELGIFSVLWSEHCSYKSSKRVLRKFPTKAPWVIQGPGENAGIVDIGDGLAAVMKIESHNHPSAIEPYQGAATGIGGILRDVITMGARPVGLLNPLYFGNIEDERVRYLFLSVVSGIADYGNCVGVPTVGGMVFFDNVYARNPIVNVMCVGIVKKKNIVFEIAKGIGNPIIVVGARTGRDGIHGATFASEELTEKSEDKRPSVQIGDPFMKKLLLEACIEAVKTKHIIGMQDMGAAGLTSSTIEMASRGKSGIEIDVSKIPLREHGMSPYEIMLSESQERMVIVCKKGKEDELRKIFEKWGILFSVVGYVTNSRRVKVKSGDEIFADIPISPLVSKSPTYKMAYKKPEYLKKLRKNRLDNIKVSKNLDEILLKLISSHNICSKEFVYRQYDYQVRTDTVIPPGSDSCAIRVKEGGKAIALTTDCNGRYVYLNPRRGGILSVCEASRNIICSGAKPLGITDCLNFGNPEDPEVFWQFREAVLGISEACRFLNIPIISGNVSFYNESSEGSIYPTPVIGMIGIINKIEHVTTQSFKKNGDLVALVGELINREDTWRGIGGSEYGMMLRNKIFGDAPQIKLDLEKRVQDAVLSAIHEKIISSAHDCSEGGLACALTECCLSNFESPIGVEIELKSDERNDFILFNESPSRIIISFQENERDNLEKILQKFHVPFLILGRVGGFNLKISSNNSILVNLDIKILEEAWRKGLKINGR